MLIESCLVQFSSMKISASQTSAILWGGMEVDMPTAIPVAPLTSRLGTAEGSTTGSRSEPSKLSTKGTVSLFRSWSISIASGVRRASV